MKTRLGNLLQGIARVAPADDREVTGLAIDSRQVKRGDLFLAFPGTATDGRRYIGAAVAAGAAAVVYDSTSDDQASNVSVPAIAVPDLRASLGAIASRFYDAPSQKLVVIGVTGTNGKTTCTQLLAQALDRAPRRCAVIGTLGAGFPGALNESLHTTPDAVTVHRLMREFLAGCAAYVSMEVSSHALHQGRVNDVAFDVAVFTNLTRDHLDYHGDMQAYGAAKAMLFDWPGLKHAVINRDDEFGRTLQGRLGPRTTRLSYGLQGGDVSARRVTPTPEGLELSVATPKGDATLQTPLFGRFNAYNLLAVLAALLLLDIPLAEAVERLRHVRSVAGRAERFGGSKGRPLVIVDYAHTPDALEKILTSLREHARGKLVCVFGCGGDRDRGKRPLMGTIAERLADQAILTNDNPRTEKPEAIVADIRAGMTSAPLIVPDRAQAIALAIANAGADDIVLVAGKGHEEYQQIGAERLPYSDRGTVRAILGEAA
ncbi:MAG TPA: UDP-N-acetylmuramoyl-L-alanyl-D-glutamate--2,6-diaminopimelate ligase [Burkholderiales bacterium]|nr:UDP-N-acetylmuramoyl-L-alanyl-D-glutamate--2,6-diaminopimelate ligase [Burkholderiales bacterium]